MTVKIEQRRGGYRERRGEEERVEGSVVDAFPAVEAERRRGERWWPKEKRTPR